MISIHTTRVSKVVATFVLEYPHAVAWLDGMPQLGKLEDWCTNARLKASVDFSLLLEETELLGFHDDSRDLRAGDETIPLVMQLAEEEVLRYQMLAPPTDRGLARRVLRNWALGLIAIVLVSVLFLSI